MSVNFSAESPQIYHLISTFEEELINTLRRILKYERNVTSKQYK